VKLEQVVDGMSITDMHEFECGVCVQGKMKQYRSREPDKRANGPLELVHCDLAGPVDPESKDGFRYALGFVDDYSGLIMTYLLKQKSDTLRATEKYLADIAPYGSIKRLRSDQGGEFTSGAFETLLTKNRIKHEMSAPHSPHQNGTVERSWHTLFDMARCLLIESRLPKLLWPYAVMAAAYTRNRCFNPRIGKTPFEGFTGQKPNVSNMHAFGSVCYAYVQDKKKLDARSNKGVFVGYDKGSPAHLVYFPDSQIVRKVRCVRFMEEKHMVNTPLDDLVMRRVTDQEPAPVQNVPVQNVPVQNAPVQNARPEVNQGQSDAEIPPDTNGRHPWRDRKPPKHLADYVTDFEDDQVMANIDYCYRVAAFPQSYEEAIASPESKQWKAAMEDEINSLKENDTFTLTPLPESRKIVGGRWVYTIKESANGSETYKARYVAKGYSQVKGIDYQETFAPTANLTSVRVLMQLAAQHDLTLHQMDVKTAYLNAPIDCDIYMEQPEGFEVQSKGGRLVYKLNKSLYGLKQSGRNWNNLLHDYLVEDGFEQSSVDHCLYIKLTERGMVVMLVWVDDLVIGASNDSLLSDTKEALKSRFKMKDLGRLSYFLGIDFEQHDGVVKMNQKRYLCKVLERFQMQDCKPRSTPCEPKPESADLGNEPIEPRKFREAVGSLVYAMTCTRPDLCWIVTKLSQYLTKPLSMHWVMVKHVLRYLKGTLDFELCYRKCETEGGLRLIGYSDADWASSVEDRRSTTGYCFALNEAGPLVSWKSRKQQTVALSSCEAEYMALAAAVQEGLYLTQLLKDFSMGYKCSPVRILEDNQGTIALAKNPVNHQRSKHIDIRYHFIRTELDCGRMVLEYCPTGDMVADIMTKPATNLKIGKFKDFIFG
jgi:hypothetical protein